MALEAPKIEPAAANGSPIAAPAAIVARKARRTRHLTAGAVVPVVLGLLAAAFAYEALQGRSAMTEVVVARIALPAGAPVSTRDTRVVRIHAADRDVLRDLVVPAALSKGWVAAVPVPAGEPLTDSELKSPARGPVLGQMSIAVPVQQAVGGALSPGDVVDVIAGSSAGAYYVAQGLRVVAVAPTSPGGGSLLGANAGYYVVVAVSKQAALRIAAALSAQGPGSGGLELVRSNGEAATRRPFYQGPSKAVP
jgi:Flp pilus assembly protein CpaB